MKAKLIEKIKNEQSWYVHENQEGLLLYANEVDDSLENNTYFFSFKELKSSILKKIVEGEIEPCNTYCDCESGSVIIEATIKNDQNDQTLVHNAWVNECDVEHDKVMRFLCTETDSYYQWKSELTQTINSVAEILSRYTDEEMDKKNPNYDPDYDKEIASEKKDWEKKVAEYPNPFGAEVPTWKEIMEKAEKHQYYV
jgi:hypothetical protein